MKSDHGNRTKSNQNNRYQKSIRRLAAGFLSACFLVGTTGCSVSVSNPQGAPSPEQESAAAAEGAHKETASSTAPGTSAAPAASGQIRPQDDYYGYVNRDYLDSLTVSYTDGEGVGGIADIMDAVDEELYQMITEIAASPEQYAPGSNRQLVRDTYHQVLDYLTTGAGSGKEHFTEVAARIRAVGSPAELKEMIRRLEKEEGVTAYFDATVESNFYDGESYALTILQKRDFAGFGMKDIYTSDDVRQTLRGYVRNVLVAAGEDRADVGKKAEDLVRLAMDISCHTDYSNEKTANPYLALDFSTDRETDALLKNLTSEELSWIYDLENPYGGWVIEDEQQLAFMSDCLCESNLEPLKTWLLCEVMYQWQNYLKNDFPFLEGYTSMPREAIGMLAAKTTCELLSVQTSELYAEYYYTEEMDRQLQQMYADIKASYRELIRGAGWLTGETRERLLRKLENMVFICGSGSLHTPDSKDAELIGADAFETRRRIDIWNREDLRKKIGTKIDREVITLPSYTVNAQYSLSNSFTICVGIMHTPYFDIHADYAENLGGLGVVIGHEIGHAFDSMCIDYDEHGVYDPEGICREDREKLAERLKQMEDYYSSFSIMDIYYVNGETTSGENYADKGAMECLMNIVKTPEDREKVFCGYARAFGMLMEDDYAISLLDEDEHSPNEIRVNAVLSSTDEFYALYDVQPSDGMYVPPEKRVSRYK